MRVCVSQAQHRGQKQQPERLKCRDAKGRHRTTTAQIWGHEDLWGQAKKHIWVIYLLHKFRHLKTDCLNIV